MNRLSSSQPTPSLKDPFVTHLVIEKDEVHLNEDKGHARGRGQCEHDVMTLGVALELEVLAELEARVDHRADAERHGAHSQIEAAVVLGRTHRGDDVAAAVRGVAVGTHAARRPRRVEVAHVFLLLCLFFVGNRKFRKVL